jgi:maltose O-acetyltransferase
MYRLFNKNYGGKMHEILSKQLTLIGIHWVNLLSNWLGNDGLSCLLRKQLLSLMGARFGPGTVIRGGGYIYGGALTTGEQCQINRNCYFDFTAPIQLGNQVVIGHGVTLITARHELGDTKRRASRAVTGLPIQIGDGVWIGANATVLPGIAIASGAVIAAGAVVTRNVPAHTLVAGAPAKAVKSLSTGDQSNHGTDSNHISNSNHLSNHCPSGRKQLVIQLDK